MINLDSFEDLESVDVGSFSSKPTTLTGGQEDAANNLWKSEDGSTNIGIWECTEGRFTADRTAASEYCHIIAGRATVVNEAGSNPRDTGPGDLLILPKGWKGERKIHQHMRKLYVINA